MPADFQLKTARLCLRAWRETDLQPFADLNADARVMEHLPALLTREESEAQAARIARHFNNHGFGLWAVEVIGGASFIGFVGLSVPAFEAPFMPCVEIGWRLAFDHWGQGYAFEAATAAVDDGFQRLNLDEILSFTVPQNLRSRRVMEKLKMTRQPADDFDHPLLPENHRRRRHVLYRLPRIHWQQRRSCTL